MRIKLILLVLAGILFGACHQAKLSPIDLSKATGKIRLPIGVTEIHNPLRLATRAHDLEIEGDPAGSTLRLAADFQGKAAIIGDGVTNIVISRFHVSGQRSKLISDRYLPPSDVTFADYYNSNGLLFTNARNLTIQDISFDRILTFPILISNSSDVEIRGIKIKDSGTLNAQGHSNTTGGILLEQGTTNFLVQGSLIENICGNGIWTHSNFGSARNGDGIIEDNVIRGTPRDAIQIGHAARVQVIRNSGGDIGFPVDEVDLPAMATPVAIDTAGNVSDSLYSDNRFEDVDGQCIDLDGFHDGRVLNNSCVNQKPAANYPLSHVGIVFNNSNPQMRAGNVLVEGNRIQGFGYGGVYLIGQHQQVIGNRFIDVNRNHCTGDMRIAHCNYAPEEPGMLRSGIYLGSHAERPAQTRSNTIRDNEISGFGMDHWCIQAAPGVVLGSNEIGNNNCAVTNAKELR